MDRHRLTSVQLVQFYLHRIKKLNPKLHAVITVSPTALAHARAADKARRHGDHRPLLGIPVIVKDNIDTTGMPTTAGSWALAGSTPRDAFIVQRLQGRRRDHHRQGQPVRVGELPVRAVVERLERDRRPDEHGLRPRSQPVRLELRAPASPPRPTSRPSAVGTETDGSIVCPSGANGIVGIKPTLGLLSRAGIVPISADQDTAGPMARNVTDAAVAPRRDDRHRPERPGDRRRRPATPSRDYTQFLDKHALEGARIGVWREGTYDPTISPEVDADPRPTRSPRSRPRARRRRPDATSRSSRPTAPSSPRSCASSRPTSPRYLADATPAPATRRRSQDLIDFNNAHPN